MIYFKYIVNIFIFVGQNPSMQNLIGFSERYQKFSEYKAA